MKLTKEQTKVASMMLKNGVNQNIVASHFRISVPTLRKYLSNK